MEDLTVILVNSCLYKIITYGMPILWSLLALDMKKEYSMLTPCDNIVISRLCSSWNKCYSVLFIC